MLDQADRDPQAALRLLVQIGELTRGLDCRQPPRPIIGWPTATRGRATATWRPKLFRCWWTNIPDDPLCRPALVWLVQYYASGEQAERLRGGLCRASADQAAGWLGRWRWPRQIERTRPDLFALPALRFSAAAAYRKQGPAATGSAFVRLQTRGRKEDAWSACARGELWLLEPKGPSPKPMLSCVTAPAKPRLDGPAGRRPLAAGQGGHAAEQPARRFALAGHGHARPRCRVPLHWHSLSPGRRGPL